MEEVKKVLSLVVIVYINLVGEGFHVTLIVVNKKAETSTHYTFLCAQAENDNY